jgi:hypothetical protein
VLEAFGHETASARTVGIEPDAPDPALLQALATYGFDWLVSLDTNRQPEVWSELMNELADGRGRLIRIKPRRTEVPTIPVLTRYWARNYERIAELMADSRCRLIQVGLDIAAQRAVRGGVRGYTGQELASLTQQSMSLAPDNSLRRLGSPRLADTPRRRR